MRKFIKTHADFVNENKVLSQNDAFKILKKWANSKINIVEKDPDNPRKRRWINNRKIGDYGISNIINLIINMDKFYFDDDCLVYKDKTIFRVELTSTSEDLYNALLKQGFITKEIDQSITGITKYDL